MPADARLAPASVVLREGVAERGIRFQPSLQYLVPPANYSCDDENSAADTVLQRMKSPQHSRDEKELRVRPNR